MWKGETGRGGGGARKCWVKSDRNGIEGKLLAAEVKDGADLKEKKQKQNGDGEIGTGGFQGAAVVRLRPQLPSAGEELVGKRERERDCNPAVTAGDACVSVISPDLWDIFPLRQKWPRDLSHCNRLMH